MRKLRGNKLPPETNGRVKRVVLAFLLGGRPGRRKLKSILDCLRERGLDWQVHILREQEHFTARLVRSFPERKIDGVFGLYDVSGGAKQEGLSPIRIWRSLPRRCGFIRSSSGTTRRWRGLRRRTGEGSCQVRARADPAMKYDATFRAEGIADIEKIGLAYCKNRVELCR